MKLGYPCEDLCSFARGLRKASHANARRREEKSSSITTQFQSQLRNICKAREQKPKVEKEYRHSEILLVYSLKGHDQLAGASAAKRERRVSATGMSSSQLAIRPTLSAVAVASSCRWVFFRPR